MGLWAPRSDTAWGKTRYEDRNEFWPTPHTKQAIAEFNFCIKSSCIYKNETVMISQANRALRKAYSTRVMLISGLLDFYTTSAAAIISSCTMESICKCASILHYIVL